MSWKEAYDGSVMTLVGACTEETAFGSNLDPVPTRLTVDCRQVTRINSSGIRGWILFFSGIRAKGTKLNFRECSPALVQQANCVNGFMLSGEVESLCLPYACSPCRTSVEKVVSVAELADPGFQAPEVPCAKCGKPAELDDELDDYLGFMRESS